MEEGKVSLPESPPEPRSLQVIRGGAEAIARINPIAYFGEEAVQAMRNTVAKDATDAELHMFLSVAARYGLDPFAKEIWFIKYVSKDEGPKLNIMTSRDGYLRVAMQHPEWDGIQSAAVRAKDKFAFNPTESTVSHEFAQGDRGPVIGGWAIVFRRGHRPAVQYADFNEYVGTSKIWAKYRSAMIIKVAEVFALKRQFGITGLLSKEEMALEGAIEAEYLMQPEVTVVAEESEDGEKRADPHNEGRPEGPVTPPPGVVAAKRSLLAILAEKGFSNDEAAAWYHENMASDGEVTLDVLNAMIEKAEGLTGKTGLENGAGDHTEAGSTTKEITTTPAGKAKLWQVLKAKGLSDEEATKWFPENAPADGEITVEVLTAMIQKAEAIESRAATGDPTGEVKGGNPLTVNLRFKISLLATKVPPKDLEEFLQGRTLNEFPDGELEALVKVLENLVPEPGEGPAGMEAAATGAGQGHLGAAEGAPKVSSQNEAQSLSAPVPPPAPGVATAINPSTPLPEKGNPPVDGGAYQGTVTVMNEAASQRQSIAGKVQPVQVADCMDASSNVPVLVTAIGGDRDKDALFKKAFHEGAKITVKGRLLGTSGGWQLRLDEWQVA